ncbi:NUDIX hydrolase [Williamsia sp. CHRR-6]|nr:NUDIX hydrolase [Williamsia sp. CHRR-6]
MPGGRSARREVVEHHGAVAVVAVDDRDRIATVTQYRHPVGRRLVELPAGLMDSGSDETPLDAAARELREEVGVIAGRWHTLVDTASSPGFTDEALRIFVATDLTTVSRPQVHDEEADMSIGWLEPQDAVQRIFAGEIVNATSVAGILAYTQSRSGGVVLREADAPWRDRPTAFDRRSPRT